MLAKVDAGALGPLLVADAHLLRRPRVVLVELVQDRLPVVGAAQLAGASGQLLRQLVVRGLAAVPQLACPEAEQLLLLEERRITLLAQLPVACGGRSHLLEEGDVALISRCRRLASLGQPRAL